MAAWCVQYLRAAWLCVLLVSITVTNQADAQLPPAAPVPIMPPAPVAQPPIVFNGPTVPSTVSPYSPSKQPKKVKPSLRKKSKPAKPNEFCLKLQDDTRLVGTLTKVKVLPLQLDFCKIEIPTKYIQSIQLIKAKKSKKKADTRKSPANQGLLVKVKLRNKDTMTGMLLVDVLNLKTTYGELKVPVRLIHVMAFGNDMKQFERQVAALIGSGPVQRASYNGPVPTNYYVPYTTVTPVVPGMVLPAPVVRPAVPKPR